LVLEPPMMLLLLLFLVSKTNLGNTTSDKKAAEAQTNDRCYTRKLETVQTDDTVKTNSESTAEEIEIDYTKKMNFEKKALDVTSIETRKDYGHTMNHWMKHDNNDTDDTDVQHGELQRMQQMIPALIDEGKKVLDKEGKKTRRKRKEKVQTTQMHTEDTVTKVDEGCTLEEHECEKNITENKFRLIKLFIILIIVIILNAYSWMDEKKYSVETNSNLNSNLNTNFVMMDEKKDSVETNSTLNANLNANFVNVELEDKLGEDKLRKHKLEGEEKKYSVETNSKVDSNLNTNFVQLDEKKCSVETNSNLNSNLNTNFVKLDEMKYSVETNSNLNVNLNTNFVDTELDEKEHCVEANSNLDSNLDANFVDAEMDEKKVQRGDKFESGFELGCKLGEDKLGGDKLRGRRCPHQAGGQLPHATYLGIAPQ
jgi:hypothetical protein